jgi:hemerythrin-like metal-binding protein
VIDDNKLNVLLEELVNTFQYHFGSEESLMAMYKYPQLSVQKMQHELMTRNVKNLVENIRHNKNMMVQLLFNLENWFIEHDNDYDKEFGKYVSEIRNNLLK